MDFGGNCYGSGDIAGAASATAVSSNDSMNSKSRNNITTKVPRTRSSSIATTTNEGGRRSRKSSSSSISRPIPTPEELNERSLKRKLEIFRGSGGQSSSRVQPEAGNTTAATAASTTTTSSSNNLVRQREDNNDSRGQSPHSHQTSTSDDDDDEEEILRLTQNSRRHRFGPPFGGCGLGYLPDSHDDNNHDEDDNSRRSPLFTNLGRRMGFGSGGRWSPPTGFLCFATPVRSNSGGEGDGVDGDIVAHLSDDNLTADEFLSRHGGGGGGGGGGNTNNGKGGNNSAYAAPPPPPPKQVSPEHATATSQSQSPNNDGLCSAMSNQGGCGSVYTEITDAQTIESALYFDQKYSHVIQTRPPMPLFQENMVTSYGDPYCRGTSTGTTSSGGGGGGGSSFLLFGEGLFSNSNVGNEISTIITKKRTK